MEKDSQMKWGYRQGNIFMVKIRIYSVATLQKSGDL